MIPLILGLLLASAHAEPLQDLRNADVGPAIQMDRYVCMRLNVDEPTMLDPKGTGIWILTAPEASAPHGTPAPSVVFVRKPEHRVAGFLEVLQLTGVPGWIAENQVKPFDPNLRCVPSEHRIGG